MALVLLSMSTHLHLTGTLGLGIQGNDVDDGGQGGVGESGRVPPNLTLPNH